jgi:hypothetical protein
MQKEYGPGVDPGLHHKLRTSSVHLQEDWLLGQWQSKILRAFKAIVPRNLLARRKLLNPRTASVAPEWPPAFTNC